MYNYFSAINAGAGDAERYKLFCSGRAAGFQGLPDPSWPAATAIGRQDHSRLLQVYWLAGERGRPAIGKSAPGERLPLSAPVRPGGADLLARHAGGVAAC